MTELADFFSEHSPLKTVLPGFKPRAGQAWMAEAVAEAIANGDKLVIEAGTGTGKTFAYLLPALLSGRKTIISTGTKALQDQLYHRDLPLVAGAAGRPAKTALLKGRNNYLCIQRCEQAEDVPVPVGKDLAAVREWRHRTETGDRAELVDVAEDSAVWPHVTSTADNCLGQKCPHYDDCHVVRARRNAQEADLVVVNHHLLLADLAMKESGFVEFLPGADAVILDEAHQLPDLAVQFFGISLGSRELERLVDDARAVSLGFADREFTRRIDSLETAVRVLRAEAPRDEGRHELDAWLDKLRAPLDALRVALESLAAALGERADGAADAEKLEQQASAAVERLVLLVSEDAWDGLRWLEVGARGIRLNLTPLDVADTLRGLTSGDHQAWVFTSATLAVGEDFTHFTARMGLDDVRALTFPSPYPLADNGIVYLPGGLPPPSAFGYTDAMLEAVMPLLEMTSGGAFLLFTSHRALNIARKWLRARRSLLGGRKLLAQGDAPRDDLLRRFRGEGNAVLLGTSSFWEGVDVRGSALTLVVIDKLPFVSPADPLLKARLEFIRREGGNGFTQHQVPQAVLALKQGAGRLLRDENDYGAIVLCDPRITGKGYGRTFLASLEPMPTTTSADDVRSFFARHEASGAVA